jgi:hypothetical protein
MSKVIQRHLLHSFRKVLQPLVKLLVKAGIQYGEFAEVVKSVFVESAIRDGLGLVTKPSRARISAVTGIPRRDVDRFIDSDGTFMRTTPTVGGAMVEVLQRWHADSRYTGPYGIPLELRFESELGERSFTHLVSLVDPTANPQEILDELVRVGSVVYSGEGHLRATSRYFMTSVGMSSEQLEYFINALTRFGKTLEHNFDSEKQVKRVERFVVADRGLPSELVTRFEEYARQQTAAFLLDLDNWLSPHALSQSEDVTDRVQTGVHVFMYIEENQRLMPLTDLIQTATDDSRR